MTRVGGPKDGEILTARFNGKGAPNLKGKSNIKSLVLLSIHGNEYCEGEYLGATIESALAGPIKAAKDSNNRSNPAKGRKQKNKSTSEEIDRLRVSSEIENNFTTFLVADKVYWHNLKPMRTDIMPDEKAELQKQAIQLGDAYLQQNLEQFLLPFHLSLDEFETLFGLIEQNNFIDPEKLATTLAEFRLNDEQYAALCQAIKPEHSPIDARIAVINQLAQERGKNFKIVRWEEWVNSDPSFIENQAQLMACYGAEPSLKISIDAVATDFAERHKKEGGFDLWFFRSQGYLAEESPAVVWLGAKKGINCILYPGSQLPCFQETANFFIVDQTAAMKPFAVRVDNPKLLVNWLETWFNRSYSREQHLAKLLSDDPFSSPSESEEDASSSAKENPHSFFQPDGKPKLVSMHKLNATGSKILKTISQEEMEPKEEEEEAMSAVKQEVETLLAKIWLLKRPEMKKEALNFVEEVLEKAAAQLDIPSAKSKQFST
ncbi:hypothetical protein [Legionella micdadei]|uniref:Uncharacterized protein n=1 Tax=Legionella micdadei TaxID=451 RepID=A0A098GFB0_LEGMI|nr:hypothetical protein [Legionella micdadei]ARG97733.1 hypothetical protein B6N58_08695 [Legionella micdadei]ARG99954.1 hypothetical protein B6V88_05725 [Legionella micdadei]KTD28435.1 hypothetical protein Lmic_1546 [Legionella micdadei]NSL18793.1 hypothetical protein [Legionella micdadei]CEG60675.1 protein of unknown function [coiled-coil] [Legionella micdadei]